MAVKIITDSTSDFTFEEAEELGIEVLPLTINIDGKLYTDGVDITKEEFYEKQAVAEKMPVTSQVTFAVFEDVFKKHINNGDEVVAVLLSSDMSGTYQSANIAKNDVCPEKISVIDSRQVTFALNLLVREAISLAKKGLCAKEIENILNEKKEKIVFLGMVATLEYLKKNGRLSGAAAVAGTLLNIKPIVTSKDGMIAQFSKMRGEKAAIEWLAKQALDEADPDCEIINIGHGFCPEKAQMLKELMPQFEDKLNIVFMGSSVGAHVGPGCVGVCYFKK